MTDPHKRLKEEKTKLEAANKAILDAAEARDLALHDEGKPPEGPTEEERAIYERNEARIEAITGEQLMREKQLTRDENFTPNRGTQTASPPEEETEPWERTTIPATARAHYPVRNFAGPGAERQAYRFGVFCAAAAGNEWARTRSRELGIRIEAATPHSGSSNEYGGAAVPEEFDPQMIILLEQFGVFRRNARRSRMRSDVKRRLRRSSGLTAYFVSEGGAGTHSKKKWDWVTLTAKDLMVLTTITSDLEEDAIINVGDDLAGEIAQAFAEKEDSCGFAGDGTSTYGGIVGAPAKIKGLSATIANIAGLVVGAGNAYSELTLANFQAVVGLLPTYADNNRARWFVHKSFWANVMYVLELAAGGTGPRDIAEFRAPRFLGYPVEFTSKMPKTEANSQVCALLGDLTLAADFGDRQGRAVQFSRDATIDSVNMFETNQIAVRGFQRFDINVHDVGNASATAANRVPGPIVGLITAAA